MDKVTTEPVDLTDVRKWAESIGFDWNSAYGHWSKQVITHNSTPPLIMEPEEIEFFYKLSKRQIADELRHISQVDLDLESYLWKRIDELEDRP